MHHQTTGQNLQLKMPNNIAHKQHFAREQKRYMANALEWEHAHPCYAGA